MEFLGWLLTILAMLSIAGFVVFRIFFFSQVVSALPSRQRVYTASPKEVSAAGVAVSEKLGYSISHIDEQAISFRPSY